jgi:hypothetical protein
MMTIISGSTNEKYNAPVPTGSYSTLGLNNSLASNSNKSTNSGAFLAFQDNLRAKKVVDAPKNINLETKSITKSNPLAVATGGTLNYLGSVWNYIVSKPEDKQKHEIKRQDVERQVRAFAKSLGQTDISNIRVQPSKPATLVVMSVEDRAPGLSYWKVGTDISWDSKDNGKPIHSENSVSINIGAFSSLGIPYLNIKPIEIKKPKKGENLPDGTKKKTKISMQPPTMQAILRDGLVEAKIRGKVSSKTIFNLDESAGFNIGFRPFNVKGVLDLDHLGKFINKRSLNIGLDFSAYRTLGYFKGSVYWEGLRFAPGKGLSVFDPFNITLSPEGIEALAKVAPPSVIRATSIATKAVATKLNAGLVVKGAGKGIRLLGAGLEKIIPAIGVRAMGISAGEYVAALAGPVGWVIAAGFLVHDIHTWNEDRKAAYKAKIQYLITQQAFRGPAGVAAALGGIVKANKFEVGMVAKMISDTIDEAYKQGLVNIPALRQEWSKMLNFKGENLIQTQLGRLVAACVLGRNDIINDITQQLMPRDKSGSVVHTDQSSLQDKIDNSNIVVSVQNPDSLKSLMLDEVRKPNTAPYIRVGSSYKKLSAPYKRVTIPFMDGVVTAQPELDEKDKPKIDDRGTCVWDVSFTAKNGVKARITIPMTGQFTQKQLIYGEPTRRALDAIINTQRAKSEKPPAYIKPWQGKLYGNTVTVVPLYMLKDGSIMWELTTTKAGKPVKIYESLGLTNQTGYQFDSSDLQDGHIFKIRLDNILSGKEKQ